LKFGTIIGIDHDIGPIRYATNASMIRNGPLDVNVFWW